MYSRMVVKPHAIQRKSGVWLKTFGISRQSKQKLEMLGSIVLRLASHRKILGEIFLSTQDGIKHPEMHKKWKVGKFFWR